MWCSDLKYRAYQLAYACRHQPAPAQWHLRAWVQGLLTKLWLLGLADKHRQACTTSCCCIVHLTFATHMSAGMQLVGCMLLIFMQVRLKLDKSDNWLIVNLSCQPCK